MARPGFVGRSINNSCVTPRAITWRWRSSGRRCTTRWRWRSFTFTICGIPSRVAAPFSLAFSFGRPFDVACVVSFALGIVLSFAPPPVLVPVVPLTPAVSITPLVGIPSWSVLAATLVSGVSPLSSLNTTRVVSAHAAIRTVPLPMILCSTSIAALLWLIVWGHSPSRGFGTISLRDPWIEVPAWVVDQPFRLRRTHGCRECYLTCLSKGLISVNIPIQGTVIIGPVLDREVDEIVIVFLERLFVEDQEAARESIDRRRGFPSRWSQFRSVNCELC